jgi:hypothetical protein
VRWREERGGIDDRTWKKLCRAYRGRQETEKKMYRLEG